MDAITDFSLKTHRWILCHTYNYKYIKSCCVIANLMWPIGKNINVNRAL